MELNDILLKACVTEPLLGLYTFPNTKLIEEYKTQLVFICRRSDNAEYSVVMHYLSACLAKASRHYSMALAHLDQMGIELKFANLSHTLGYLKGRATGIVPCH
jgi:hypothetical protein